MPLAEQDEASASASSGSCSDVEEEEERMELKLFVEITPRATPNATEVLQLADKLPEELRQI